MLSWHRGKPGTMRCEEESNEMTDVTGKS